MPPASLSERSTTVRARLASFIVERHPFALNAVLAAFDRGMELFPTNLETALRESALGALGGSGSLPDTTPGVSADDRIRHAISEVLSACDGFLRREVIAGSLTREEKREMLRGMILTRAIDNRLKAFFSGGEVRFGNASFQGKGFRSLGQEAIYACAIRLRRGESYRGESWQGDVVAPLIRDLGAALAMHPHAETVRMALSAQMAKAGPPMDGRDLHIGDFSRGILPATAPLTISTLNVAGLAMAFRREAKEGEPMRVAISLVGEGGSSLGEWHEAINLCAARRLPAIFCVQNNQTALATPLADQTAARVFAEKAPGYGIPGITIDGTDPEAIAAAFAWAAERAREGKGPTLIELVAMRMCGHAHHDDMLYLGKEPPAGWDYPPLTEQGYADRELYDFWSRRDPIPTYAERLEAVGVIDKGEAERWKRESEELVEAEARTVIEAPWPDPATAGVGVFANEPPRSRVDVLDPALEARTPELPPLDAGPPFDPNGRTFLEAVMLGVADAMRADPRVFVYGEDVGGKYGNAFLLLRPLLKEFGDRILNSTLSEAGVLGVCVGAALGGQRPIGEIQFNDFVATGFNQLVNNAAKIRYRWGGSVPMVVRMPWGGLRHAGPYHSQNTEPWFYRTPGLKIVAPSTPYDARALMRAAVEDPDPVLYYEHIALYRDPRIKQALDGAAPQPLPIGKAALRRAGSDLAIISYGAYVHVAMRVAAKLAQSGIEASVLDLRSLVPLDREAILALARHCSRVLIVHEDTRTGGIGESIAAIIQEEAFDWLDAPIRILGALDTPVPYSPPLEQAFLPGEEEIELAARRLVGY
jgi:2-oxoisovalerate dehydrogenase E1 component